VENLLPSSLLGTPRRTVVAGVGALILATVLLLVYLSHYRNSVKSTNASAAVLVAKRFIPKGTTALDLAKSGLFEVAAIPKGQLKEGAITDAAVLRGEVALDDVYPGQQLTIADFGLSPTSTALSGVLSGTWRAISIPLDASRGISPQTQTGDHVDVYAQVNGIMGLLLQNVLVLAAPNQAATGTSAPTSANYIFRVPTNYAPRFAYAAQNGQIWLALRGQKGVPPARQAFVTATNVFGGR
jgi:Flp pilus assembly protein CpaB